MLMLNCISSSCILQAAQAGPLNVNNTTSMIFTECENDGLEDRALSAAVDLPKQKLQTDKMKWKKFRRNKKFFPLKM